MELEDIKKSWAQMSQDLEKQKILTNELILKMAHQKSSKSLGKLIGFETVGGFLMSIALSILVILNFYTGNLTGTGLTICGIGSLIIFAASGLTSLNFILKMKRINLLENTIEVNLNFLNDFKRTLKQYKKLNMITAIPTMVFFIPVVVKIFNDKNVFENFEDARYEFYATIILSVMLSLPVLFYVIKFYSKNIKKTEEAVKEARENANNY